MFPEQPRAVMLKGSPIAGDDRDLVIPSLGTWGLSTNSCSMGLGVSII